MRRMNRDPADALLPETVQRISREEMSDLPIGRYEGSVHLVAAPADLQRASPAAGLFRRDAGDFLVGEDH
jgi:hypothetical protein